MEPKLLQMSCPFCKSSFEADEAFAKSNGRLFCPHCCKAFDVKLKNDDQFPDWLKTYIADDKEDEE